MAERTLQAKLKVRSDTATNWQSNNPVLLQGEPALETDTNKLKFGNGTSAYNDLPYVSSDAVTVEANPADEATQTLEKLRVQNSVYSIPQGTEVIDLGTVTLTGTEEEASGTVTVTPEQATKMKAETPPIVNFEAQGGMTYSLSRLTVVPNVGGGKDGITFAGTYASKSGDGVVAIHCAMLYVAAGSTDSTITADISISTIYQTNEASGVEVINLGEVTLTEQEIAGVKIAMADGITVSAEQATQAQATPPCIAKAVIKGATYEFIRTKIFADASATYILFAATDSSATESAYFYNLQIKIPLPNGTASASLLMLGYNILGGLNLAYEAGELSFENGVATKTLTEEEVGEWGYNQIRFWDNANSSEQYTLYLSHTNTGASLIDSHNYDYFGIVENASVTGEAGGITAFSAYLEGTTLTIERITIGGSGVEVVDLGTVALTQSGTDETVKTGTVSITSEQLSQMTGSVPAVVKFTISGSGSLQISLSERVGDASSPSVVAYVGAFQNGTNTIKSYLVNVSGSSATIQEVTLYTVTPNAGTGGTPLTSLKIGATTYSIPQGSQINNGIPEGGLAGQALTKQSGADYDVAWTSINTSEPTVITEAAYAEALEAGTVESDKLYYIQGTSDDTLTTAAESTTYDNASSGLTATNVQAAIDELKEDEFSGSYNDLTDKPTIPTTLAELSEKSYNDLTDKPTIPTLDIASIATALGLTTTQLNNLIAFAKSITSANTSGTTVNNEFAAQSFDTTA